MTAAKFGLIVVCLAVRLPGSLVTGVIRAPMRPDSVGSDVVSMSEPRLSRSSLMTSIASAAS